MLNGSSVPLGHETVSGTGHFCAGHMISVCLALTLRWAETGPLLPWARVTLLCPYFALGLDFGAYASARVSYPWSFPCEPPPFLHWARALLVHAAHLGREARALPCKRGSEGVCCRQARRGRRRFVPLLVLALAGLASSSDTDRRTAATIALEDGLSSLLLLSVGAAASAPPST